MTDQNRRAALKFMGGAGLMTPFLRSDRRAPALAASSETENATPSTPTPENMLLDRLANRLEYETKIYEKQNFAPWIHSLRSVSPVVKMRLQRSVDEYNSSIIDAIRARIRW